MKYASLRKYVDPADEQKLRFKKPLWFRVNGGIGFLLSSAISLTAIDVFIGGMIRQHQTEFLAWFLCIVFFVLPFVLMSWACLFLMGPEETILDLTTRTYTIRRGAFLFPKTSHGSFKDVLDVRVATYGAKSGGNSHVRLEWKSKRRYSTLDILNDYAIASEFGWQLADELGVAFRDN